jgi:single-strand DNA-binding protein
MNRGLNKVMVIGAVSGDPEIRRAAGNLPVASFSVATPRTWLTADGEQREAVEWINVVAWGTLAEMCSTRLTDTQQLYIEGRLQTREWKDNNGNLRYHTEVVAQEIIVLDNE